MTRNYFVCVDNSNYKASLEKWKIYKVKIDSESEKLGLLNVIDESGENYFYPDKMFVRIDLPLTLRKKMKAAQS